MSAKGEAAKTIAVFAKMVRPILAAADQLEREGSLEDVEGDLKRRIAGLKDEEAGWLAKIDGHKGAVEAASVEVKGIIDKAHAAAAEIRQQGDDYHESQRQQANSLIVGAKTEANRIKVLAETDGAAIRKKASDDVQALSAQKVELAQECDGLKNEIERHKAILQDLKNRLAPALKDD